jgi:dipeptidyl aminopeptidase/acylaminoacyl peptidase
MRIITQVPHARSVGMPRRLSAGAAGALCSLALASAAVAEPVLVGPPPRPITPPLSITSPVLPGSKPIPVDALFKSSDSNGAVWGADGSIVYNSDQAGRMNIWVQPPGGKAASLLARSEDRQYFPSATPDGKWLIYQSDRGGREIFDLYIVPAAGGPARNLTATDDVSETMPVVSPDSRLVAYSARAKTKPMTDLGVIDLKTGARRLLTAEADGRMMWTAVAFSRDGRTLIANRSDLLHHSAVYRIDVKSGAATRLTAPEESAYNAAGDLSSDGRWISVTTETARGDRQAAVMDARSGALTLVRPDGWEQTAGKFSPDGRTLLCVSNIDGRDTTLAYDVVARKAATLPLPNGVNSDFFGFLPAYSPDGRHILFPHSAGDAPLDYWVYDTASRTAHRATHMAAMASSGLPRTRIVHYASADGTVVSAVLWLPYNLKRDGGAPGIIYPHGGPTGQTKDSFDRTATALASRGYLVLAPNPRGSTGYGRAFMEANRRDLGGGDLEDEVAGLKFLVATGYADPKRIGITGGSYGGYMTLMAVAKTPTLWAAAVDEYGIVNWTSMYEHGSPQLREYQAALIGDPAKDRDVYERVSPLTFLGQTKAPLLVLQGENDIRVPKEESEQIVNFLRERGRTVDVHYYPEEGHGFSKREDQIDALNRTIAWLDRYMR